MKALIPIIAAACILFSASGVSAAFTVSISMPTKSLTENEQISVTVTVTNPGTSAESNVVVQLAGSPTSWFGMIQDCSVISSIAASQSQTSTCILRPTTVGSDFSLVATAESSGGTTGSGTTGGITVISAAGSIAASMTAPSSADLSSSFDASVAVTAPSSSDATNARATITASGACSVDTSSVAAAQNLGTISQGTTESPLDWDISAGSSAGTCTLTVNVVSDNAGTANPSKSVTVGTSSSSTSSSSGGGGGGSGGGGGGAAAVSESKTIASIKSGEAATAAFSKVAELKLYEISIEVKRDASAVKITLSGGSLPSDISPPVAAGSGEVLKYIQVEKANITDNDISRAALSFRVEKGWIETNNIDQSKVSLYRLEGKSWSRLQTVMTREDSSFAYYAAASPGLSLFAIAGEKKSPSKSQQEAQPTQQPEGEQPAVESVPEEETGVAAAAEAEASSNLAALAVAIGALAAFIFFMRRKAAPALIQPSRKQRNTRTRNP